MQGGDKREEEKTEEEKMQWKEMKEWGGEGMTETNASTLTAVLHFQRDRHKIEDQKSNKPLKD